MRGPRLGRTRRGRLRLLDAWLVRQALPSGPVVDVGLGALPWTTVELAEALPGRAVLGVDVDAARVAVAREHARPGLGFAVAGLDLPVRGAAVVRVMNLLRGVGEAEAREARWHLGRALGPAGLLVEGSTDRPGSTGAAWVLRGPELEVEGLLVVDDLARGWAPAKVRGVLPVGLRGRGGAGERLLRAWTEAWEAVRSHDLGASFVESARALGAEAGRVEGGAWACVGLRTPRHLPYSPSSSSDSSPPDESPSSSCAST